MNRLSVTRVSSALAVFGVITYAVCFIWHALAHTSFTDSAFVVAFPGFSWSVTGFLTGLGWSIVYSVYTGVVFVVAYNLCCRVTVDRRTRAEHPNIH